MKKQVMRRALRKNWVEAPRAAEPAIIPQLSWESDSQRAHPGQAVESSMWLYVPSPNLETYALQYILNNWVYTAISRIASKASRASAQVFDRKDEVKRHDNHPLMALLSEYGKPNDYQDTYEFMEQHFINYDLYGNSIWHWVSKRGGRPTEVHILDPRNVEIKAGTSQRYGDYFLIARNGTRIPLSPDSITHSKRFNPFNAYWGLSALQSIDTEIRSDKHMALWNEQFFGENVGIPAGIVILPADTPQEDARRIEEEHNGRFGMTRRTLVARGTIGGSVYHPAGAVHKDLDFKEGRMISRKAIYEALQLPLGLLSEASTEAHARVAERQFYDVIDTRLERLGRKLTADALPYWSSASRYAVRFIDDRRDVDDWEQKQKKVDTMLQTHSINEVRMKVYGDAPVPWGERKANDERQDDSGTARDEAGTGGDEDGSGSAGIKQEATGSSEE